MWTETDGVNKLRKKERKHQFYFKSPLKGCLIKCINPKTYSLFLAFLPQFIVTNIALYLLSQMLLLGGIFNGA